MRALDTLRRRITALGPAARDLLIEIDRIDQEFELRAKRIAALSAANQITAALAQVDEQQDVDRILDHILMAALVLSGAERGLVVRKDADSEAGFAIVASRRLDGDGELEVSSSLIRQILERGEGIATTNVQQDDRFEAGVSLIVTNIRSVMATPIRLQGKVIGGVYVDSRLTEQVFSETDLKNFSVFADNAAVALNLATSLKARRDLHVQSVLALVNAVEAADAYTAGHASRVGYYARGVAAELGLDDKDLELVTFAGYLHDIGKIALTGNVIKPGPLSDDEWRAMRKHPLHGERILRNSPALAAILPAIRNHHERWDGEGYPDRLQGEAIDLFARIIAVADAFDAMTTDRPYRAALRTEQALCEIEDQAGSHFDPQVAEVFLRAFARGRLQLVAKRGEALPLPSDLRGR